MIPTPLDRAVAHQTGESLATVHRLGFQPDSGGGLEPEEIHLVFDCPFCGRVVPYPGRGRDGSLALAECLDPACAVDFDYPETDVYAA